MDSFDLLDQRGLWHTCHGRTDRVRHLQAGCAGPRSESAWGALREVSDPVGWCVRCAGTVRAVLTAWHATAGASGAPALVLARIGHPVLQPPARWLLEPLLAGVCAEPGRLTRWVAVVGPRTAAWLGAVGSDPDIRADSHRIRVFDGLASEPLAHTAAALWDPFGGGPLADAAAAVTAARRLVPA